jgi:hypothetical protein
METKMSAHQVSHGSKNDDLRIIENIVQTGRAVVSCEDSAIVDQVLATIQAGRTATFYVKLNVFREIRKRYWALGRGDPTALHPISAEQATRIKSKFNLDIDGFANRVNCPRCDQPYSTYEFIEQGFEEHGEEMIQAVFALKNVGVLQVNPTQTPACRGCQLDLTLAFRARLPVIIGSGSGGYDYDYTLRDSSGAYACCR